MSKGHKIWIWIFVFVVFVLAINTPQMIKAWQQKKALDRAFSDYSAALVRNDFASAYKQCGTQFQEVTSYQSFVEQQKHLQSNFGSLRNIHKHESVVQGRGSPVRWSALIKADLQYGDSTILFAYEFHYEGTRWVLFGYKQL